VFLVEARSALARLERAVMLTKQTALGEQGRFVIRIAPTAPFHPVVPQSVRCFSKPTLSYPLTMEECLSRHAVVFLGSGQINVAFLRALLAPREELEVGRLKSRWSLLCPTNTRSHAGGRRARRLSSLVWPTGPSLIWGRMTRQLRGGVRAKPVSCYLPGVRGGSTLSTVLVVATLLERPSAVEHRALDAG
jgi:DNA-binding transcriptional LysR family regulator